VKCEDAVFSRWMLKGSSLEYARGDEKKKSKVSVGYWKNANGRKQHQVKRIIGKKWKISTFDSSHL